MRKKKVAEHAEHKAVVELQPELSQLFSLPDERPDLRYPWVALFGNEDLSIWPIHIFHFSALGPGNHKACLGILPQESMQRIIHFKCLALPQNFLIFPFLNVTDWQECLCLGQFSTHVPNSLTWKKYSFTKNFPWDSQETLLVNK